MPGTSQITSTDGQQGRLIRYTILLVAFLNGFAIMSVELLGGRVLAPYFGTSVYVWGSIITVFMLSLSLGYLWGGRLSSRQPSPGLYAAFFLVAALLCLPIIYLSDWTMSRVFMVVEDPRYGSLLSAILLYFLPICVMGMVSPYSIRLLVSTEQHSGRMAGLLYFISTIGSALGTLATSFYFVLWFDIDTIMWGIVTMLLLCGGWILFLDRRLKTGQWNRGVANPRHSE